MAGNVETVQSKSSQDAVECPHCGHRDAIYTWGLLEATCNPEQAARLASGALLVHACSQCSAQFPLDYPLFYIDRNRRTCAYYPAGEGELTAISTAFRQATIRFKGVDLRALRKGEFEMRVVPEQYQLAEKVAIWQAGLDDMVVEVLKQTLIDELGARDNGKRIADAQVIGLNEDGDIEFMLFAQAEGDGPDAQPETYGIKVPALAYERLNRTLDIRANIDLRRHDPVIDASWAREVLEAAKRDAAGRG